VSDPDNMSTEAAPEEAVVIHPLAVGYWRHMILAIVIMVTNIAVLVGLISASYGVYQRAKSVAEITPVKRLDVVQETLEGGRASLQSEMSTFGIHQQVSKLGSVFDAHRHFYQTLLASEHDFSRLLHRQQNSVTFYATRIGRSSVWQQRYTNSLLALPGRSAQRQFIIQQTHDSLLSLPTLAD
jgi:hypothetical protein